MPPSKPKLGKYLEWNNGTIRVTLSVPRSLVGVIGKTKIKRSLHTDSPANAERVKHGIIQELKEELAAAELIAGGGPKSIAREALDWRESAVEASNGRAGDALSFLISERAEELERSEGPKVAHEFADIAMGRATPIDQMLEIYLSESGLKERSKNDARRAVSCYCEWCAGNDVPQTTEAATGRTVGKFVSEHLLASMQRKTAQKYLSFLSGYWRWMEAKGYADDVPWTRQLQGVGKAKPKQSTLSSSAEKTNGGKRAYTDDEARLILYASAENPTDQRTLDLSWIAALSGMRLDEICRLRVADCIEGWFNVNSMPGEGKTDAAARKVPIHSKLGDVMGRRTKGKAMDDFLIEDLPAPDIGRERSMPASKAYTRFRRKLGVDEIAPGQRQSNVDFHSWRRWFARRARDAQNSVYTIADLIGHDTTSLPGGLTMSTYAGMTSEDDMRTCVESVTPPSP